MTLPIVMQAYKWKSTHAISDICLYLPSEKVRKQISMPSKGAICVLYTAL